VQAQTLTVLHSFTDADGAYPVTVLVRDAAGNLYGATQGGGSTGYGTVFKIDTSNTETVLHSFTNTPDGALPDGGLITDGAGNLYGIALGDSANGVGTVFKVDTSNNTETILHTFTNTPDGAFPVGSLVRDAAGNLYGTTQTGGSANLGTVFKIDTSNTETILHSFTNTPDGSQPFGSMVMDAAGNLYGTTNQGGASGFGTVFKLDTSNNTETVLHSFAGLDGRFPAAGLIMDAAGNIYGTTGQGGADYGPMNTAWGTVFKIDTSNTETVLHSFTNTPDGQGPNSVLTLDAAGNLYGTTVFGGASGLGTVFKIDTSNTETVLHSFTGAEGSQPAAGLILDSAGNLYGTASRGTSNAGTVFELIQTIPVTIDIKPGQDPPSINTKNRGTIPVAILSTPTFDALTQVNQTSLTFGRTGSEKSLAFCSDATDVNGDGLPDLICNFNTVLTGFQAGDTTGVLEGKTVNGTIIMGSDSVIVH